MACISDLFLNCSLLSFWLSSLQSVGILFLILPFTALQNLVVEYFKRNQWGRSWGATTSQEPWFWQDISWASGFEDNWFCKSSIWAVLLAVALYFGWCCTQQYFITYAQWKLFVLYFLVPWIRYFYCSHKYCVFYFGVSVGCHFQVCDFFFV